MLLAGAILLTGQSFQKQESGKRIAFIVAIGKYPQATGWGKLSSLNDDTIITQALMKQGFTEFIHIHDEKATIEGIRKGFNELYQKTNPNDIVYIHFSSHGQQLWDDNKDENDGYDEAIVTYGAPSQYYEGYNGEKHMRDDELGMWVKKIRSAAGPAGDVMVVVDACHSGTALRGPVTRGNVKPMAPPTYNPLDMKKSDDPGAADSISIPNTDLSPMVLFSASRAHEPNQEYQGFGSLSLALTRTFDQIKQGDSYRKLFAMVNNEMTSMGLSQVPVLEGQVDRNLFGGKEIKQASYYPVKNILTSSIDLEGGTLNGLFVGCKVALMPAGSTEYNAEKAVFTGTISSAGITKSYMRHDANLSGYKPKQLWAFVIEQSYGSQKLLIGCGEGLSGKNKSAVKDNVLKLQFAQWEEKNPELVIHFINNQYQLAYLDGRQPFRPVDMYQALNGQLSDYMQGKIMREAHFSDPDMKVELVFTPCEILQDEMGNVELLPLDANSRMKNGAMELLDEDAFKMRLINSGSKNAYVNILEIDPTGVVRVVLPNYDNNENAFDFMIMAGDTIDVADFVRQLSGPEFGKYTYKVFATPVPVSFRQLYNTRGNPESSTTVQHPAAQLFQYTYQHRGPGNISTTTTSAGTTTEYSIRLNSRK